MDQWRHFRGEEIATKKIKRTSDVDEGVMEAISSLNPLFNCNYFLLNSYLKKDGARTKKKNTKFLSLLCDDINRVDAIFREAFKEFKFLIDSSDIAPNPHGQTAVKRKALFLQEFLAQNRAAFALLIDRFDFLTPGYQAHASVNAMDVAFLEEESDADKILERILLQDDKIDPPRRPGDGLGALGFFFGSSVVMLIAVIILLNSPGSNVGSDNSSYDAAYHVFRMFMLLALYLFVLSFCFVIFTVKRVDWAFIFNIQTERYMQSRHYMLLASQVAFITLVGSCGYLVHIRFILKYEEYWILGVFLAQVLFLINPFNFGHRRSRGWLLRTLGRILLAPFTPVEFRDFWLGDQLCSMTFLLGDFGYSVCYFSADFARNTNTCSAPQLHWIRAVCAAIPYLFRLIQCGRRFYDSREGRDLVNAGKYCSSLLVICFAALHDYFDSVEFGTYRIIYIVIACVATLYAFIWDVFMDWGLGRLKYKLLRKNLIYPGWVYYTGWAPFFPSLISNF
jgi:hypothetical protein